MTACLPVFIFPLNARSGGAFLVKDLLVLLVFLLLQTVLQWGSLYLLVQMLNSCMWSIQRQWMENVSHRCTSRVCCGRGRGQFSKCNCTPLVVSHVLTNIINKPLIARFPTFHGKLIPPLDDLIPSSGHRSCDTELHFFKRIQLNIYGTNTE